MLESNGYFTFSNNPAWPDVKVRVSPRWRGAHGMGSKALSKTVTCHHFGEDKSAGKPVVSLLALRAWTVHKMRRAGFHFKEAHRARFVESQLQKLRDGLRALGNPADSTGSSKADKKIRLWADLDAGLH